MRLHFLLFTTAYAQSTGNSVDSVVCNGLNKITFDIIKGAGATISKFRTLDCPMGDLADMKLVEDTHYTVQGDTYKFDMNPYERCMPTPDPNVASTYSVRFKVVAMHTLELVAGQEVILAGDQFELRCNFDDNYQVQSDLSVVQLAGETISGPEFTLDFAMVRTDADYNPLDAAIAPSIETNSLVYHQIESTTPEYANSELKFKPYNIRLQRSDNDGVFFDLFKVNMQECGFSNLDFAMTLEGDKWRFVYRQILLDSELNNQYKLVVDLQLCGVGADSERCLAADVCVPQSAASSLVATHTFDGPYPTNRQNLGTITLSPHYFLEINALKTGDQSQKTPRNLLGLFDTTGGSMPAINFSFSTYLMVTTNCPNRGQQSGQQLIQTNMPDWQVGQTRKIRVEMRTTDVNGVMNANGGYTLMRVFVDDVELPESANVGSHSRILDNGVKTSIGVNYCNKLQNADIRVGGTTDLAETTVSDIRFGELFE